MSMNQQTNPTFDITLPEEIQLIQQTVRHLAENEIAPHVMKWDESQEFPHEAVNKLSKLGFLGPVTPEEFGGAGLSTLANCVIIEELARVDPSVALIVAAHSGLCLEHLNLWASTEQKKKYIPDLATGRKIGSWCLTEPTSGSDAGGMKSTALLDGNSYILNGSKTFITNGSHASTFVVTAKTDPQKGHNGISAFIVEKEMGVIIGKKENKLGMRASDTVQLAFDNVRVPKENLIGKEGDGFKQILKVLVSGRIGIASLAVGLAQGAFEAALKYSKERIQFGKPIAEFQGIQFKLADMATEIEAARLLAYRAAVTKMKGEDSNLISAQAKLYASEIAQKVATDAVQILGGYGYIKEYPVEKFYRDVKLLTIGEGTSEVQKIVIARSLLKS